MAKKINPKDQTKKLSSAKWELLQRNDKAKKEYENQEEIRSFREQYEKQRKREAELLQSHPALQPYPKMKATDEFLSETMQDAAAIDGSLALFGSWIKTLKKFELHPLLYNYREKQSKYRAQILMDAKLILNELIHPNPSQSLVIVVDMERSKEVIMAEVEEIVTDQLTRYRKEMSSDWIVDENNKLIRIERNDKKARLKWLSIIDELLDIWDEWVGHGQRRCFNLIAKKKKMPESTVKARWRMAYRLINGQEYSKEVAALSADELCAKCKDQGKCYRTIEGVMDFCPCAEYLKLTGKSYTREKLLDNFDAMADQYISDEFKD